MSSQIDHEYYLNYKNDRPLVLNHEGSQFVDHFLHPILCSNLQGQLYTLLLCNIDTSCDTFRMFSMGGISRMPCVIWPIGELFITYQLTWLIHRHQVWIFILLPFICVHWLQMLNACRVYSWLCNSLWRVFQLLYDQPKTLVLLFCGSVLEVLSDNPDVVHGRSSLVCGVGDLAEVTKCSLIVIQ